MLTRPFGATGERLPVLGQGTWNLEQADADAVAAALHAGLDAGMSHVDTAEMYGSGAVEELLGRVLDGRRDEVFLASKVLPSNASYKGTLAACERSLRRLRTDRLDLYLLHWPGEHPLAETLDAFEELRTSGKVRHYGVSNFDAEELDEAVRLAGPGRIACNQVLYHVGERAIEHRVLPFCRREDVALVAYSPFGGGDTDGFPPAESSGGRVLTEVAAECGATPRQVALAFLLDQGGVFAIPKSASAAHVRENAQAAEVILTADQRECLEAAFPRGEEPRVLPVI